MMYCVKLFMVVAILASINENANGQSIGYGGCPTVSVKQNFDLSLYTGRWYEYERIINTFQLGGSCVTADYAAEVDSYYGTPTGNILVTNSMSNWRGKRTSISGKAYPLDESNKEGKFLVSFKGVPVNGSYWVLDTNYWSYSVVYSCTPLWGIFNLKFLWLLTTEPEPPQGTIDQMKEVLQSNGLSSYLLSKTNQRNCQYT